MQHGIQIRSNTCQTGYCHILLKSWCSAYRTFPGNWKTTASSAQVDTNPQLPPLQRVPLLHGFHWSCAISVQPGMWSLFGLQRRLQRGDCFCNLIGKTFNWRGEEAKIVLSRGPAQNMYFPCNSFRIKSISNFGRKQRNVPVSTTDTSHCLKAGLSCLIFLSGPSSCTISCTRTLF